MHALGAYVLESLDGLVFYARAPLRCAGEHVDAGSALRMDQLQAWLPQCGSRQIEEGLEVRSFNTTTFRLDLEELLEGIPTLSALYKKVDHQYLLKHILELLSPLHAFKFRLALLRQCLPFEYQRTLFCIWFVIFEAELTDRELNSFKNLVVTALGHDLGLLDVDRRFTRHDHDPRMHCDDDQGYYSHVHRSAEFVSRWLPTSERVLRGIRQHHEKMDGTGFPAGLSGNGLAEYGQHIHLYDTLFSVYKKNYQPLNKGLADLKPIIEINAVTHFGKVAVRLLDLLEKAPRSSRVFFSEEEYPTIQARTDLMAQYVEASLGIIQQFTADVGFRHEDRSLFSLQNSFIHIALSYYKLRILHKQAMLADSMSDDGAYSKVSKAVEENYLSLREIIFHINKFLYRLRLFESRAAHPELRTAVSRTITALDDLNVLLLERSD